MTIEVKVSSTAGDLFIDGDSDSATSGALFLKPLASPKILKAIKALKALEALLRPLRLN